MINCMEKIADYLGVELGEPFKIADKWNGIFPHDYRITKEKGIERRLKNNVTHWETLEGETFRWFLIADIKIVNKLPWKPQQGEKYYVPKISVHPENMYYEYIWEHNSIDMRRYNMWLVCETKEEATVKAKKMLTALLEEEE